MSPDVRRPLRPLRAGARIAVLLVAVGHVPPASANGYDDAGYFRFVDRVAAAVPVRWSDEHGAYFSDNFGYASRTNANLLLLHSVAALREHHGASRRDDHARRLVDTMTRPPMLLLPSATPPSGRTICWSRDLTWAGRDHVSLDSQIAEALAMAYRARRELGLPPDLARRAAGIVDRCARHPGWRFPRLLVNQFNWNAQLYASAARMTGHHDQLRGDYRRFLAQFTAGITRPVGGNDVPNLGPGYGFHYVPHRPAYATLNFDTPEYANIVLSGLRYYEAARHAGMAPLSHHQVRLLRAWVTRVLAGSWTHAGFLNWDTGHGRGRWQSGQYWAFAQQGLLAIASAPEFWSDPRYGRWVKSIFDNGLDLYVRWADEAGAAIAPQNPFDVRSDHRDHDLYATRIAANAARAIVLGLGSRRAQEPPPLYAYDPEFDRLGVSTPSYSTAIVPDNHRAFAYGGIDLARLYGPGHRVAANIGGEPPNTFGVVVHDAAGRELLASQHGRIRSGHLWLTRSPRGRIGSGRPYPARPYAGPFSVLEARGSIAGAGARVASDYTFHTRRIEARWHVHCVTGCAGRSVDVLLPTWGALAAVDVFRNGGGHVRLAGEGRDADTIKLAKVERIELGRGRAGSYTVEPLGARADGRLRIVATHHQPTDTHPGPTLAIRLVAHRRFRHATLALRLTPHGGGA